MVAGDRYKVVEVEGVVEAEVVAEDLTVVAFVEGGLQGAEADLVVDVAVDLGAEGDFKTLFLYFI